MDSLLDILETALTVVAPAPEPETDVDADGFLVNPATQEVVGHESFPDGFAVRTREHADDLLEFRSAIEGRVAALQLRKAAMIEAMDARIRHEMRRLAWWEWRFRTPLLDFARTQLTGKSKTLNLSWGRISFRKTAGTNRITDEDEAIAFVKTWLPTEVKVVPSCETVSVKAVLAAKAVAEKASGETVGLPFVASTGPGESAEIQTGIEIEGEK